MKKLTLTIITIFAVTGLVHAQWTVNGTNTYFNLTGNVGVGANASTAKFAVYQPAALGSVAKNNLLLSSFGGSAANNVQNNLWLVRNAAGSDFTTARLHDGISIDGSFLTPQTNTLTWWERDPTTDIQSWGNAANTYVTINKGNVGIGTINPNAKLHTQIANNGLNIIGGFQNSDGTETGGNAVGIGFLNEVQGSWWKAAVVHERTGSYGTGSLKLLVNNSADNSTVTLNDTRMTIVSSGNVGIGITSPQNKLDVNGTIHSKAVNIDLNGWSDYVLKNDYQLRPLSEVKKYIDQNRHLPEIPSEQEMIKKGLDVSKMNQLLMKKVEELTLYLIEKDEQIQERLTLAKVQADAIKKQAEISNAQTEAIKALQAQIKLLINLHND